MQSGTLLSPWKPFYYSYDAGDYWGESMEKHLLCNLGMITKIDENELYVKHKSNKVVESCRSYVEHSLNDECSEFDVLTEATFALFD